MSESEKTATDPLGIFGRYLTLWVALSIAAGIGLGNIFPQAFALLSHLV